MLLKSIKWKFRKFYKTATTGLRIKQAWICIAIGLLVGDAGLLPAAEPTQVNDVDVRVAFEPVGFERLPRGFSNGTFPGFDFEQSDRLNSFPSQRGRELIRTRDPNFRSPPNRTSPVRPESELSESEKIQLRLTSRYGNPVLGRFLQSVSTDRAFYLYNETTQLIDTRHLNPTSYSARTRQAVENLLHAVGNRMFLQTNGLSPSRSRVDTFRESLSRLASSASIRTATDARNLMGRVMQLAQGHMGIRPTTVVLEFVYGAAESLDKYSSFIPHDNSREPSVSLEEHVVGIGVEIKQHDDGAIVLKALLGGPAESAGLQRGDVITAVDGRQLAGRSMDYAVDLITGPVGSPVLLITLRDGRQRSPLTLIRRRIEIHSVSDVRMIDKPAGVAYLKLDKFSKTSSNEMDRVLWDLYRAGMKSLILDLRGNPGGLLTSAVELSNKFLPSGPIVSTRGRTSADNSSETANYERTWKIPLVVLMDGDSASASEIFAAAIQENARGLIVGRRSHGKGTVQTYFPLRTTAGSLKLTTAKFYSPTGREMAGAGVEPDIRVSRPRANADVLPLLEDRDVEAAIQAARSPQVNKLATAKSRLQSRVNQGLQLEN